MKRQNIVPAIIILAAILLSTFVLADVPIPETDDPSDDEIVVEDELGDSSSAGTPIDDCGENRERSRDHHVRIKTSLERSHYNYLICKEDFMRWISGECERMWQSAQDEHLESLHQGWEWIEMAFPCED